MRFSLLHGPPEPDALTAWVARRRDILPARQGRAGSILAMPWAMRSVAMNPGCTWNAVALAEGPLQDAERFRHGSFVLTRSRALSLGLCVAWADLSVLPDVMLTVPELLATSPEQSLDGLPQRAPLPRGDHAGLRIGVEDEVLVRARLSADVLIFGEHVPAADYERRASHGSGQKRCPRRSDDRRVRAKERLYPTAWGSNRVHAASCFAHVRARWRRL